MHARCVTAALLLALAAASPAQAQKKAARAEKVDRHQCRIGPEEKQTRFIMETVQNKPVYLAYWNKVGGYRCSFEARRSGDGYTRWSETSVGTVIKLIQGTLLIERNGNDFEITLRDVDRMTYCGQFGLLSGVLTVPANKAECTWKEMTSEEAGDLNR